MAGASVFKAGRGRGALGRERDGPNGTYLFELVAQPGGPRGGHLKNRARGPYLSPTSPRGGRPAPHPLRSRVTCGSTSSRIRHPPSDAGRGEDASEKPELLPTF